jgi:hypothetical protein
MHPAARHTHTEAHLCGGPPHTCSYWHPDLVATESPSIAKNCTSPVTFLQGKAVLVFELVRPSPSTTPQELANLAKQYVSLGADALAVRTDSDDTSTGMVVVIL